MSKYPHILFAKNHFPNVKTAASLNYNCHDMTGFDHPSDIPDLQPSEIRGVVTKGESHFGADDMDALPNLEIISNFGVGYDGVDAVAAAERGIMVTHTPDVLSDDTANTALALALNLTRKIRQAESYVRDGLWPNGPVPLATSMVGKRAGIVGLGRIGLALASRLEACGMDVAYCNRSEAAGVTYPYFKTPMALAEACDMLFLCLPGGEGSHHLIGADVFAALGPAGYLVNTGRGSVVDEAALIRALQDGVIAGAGLDVFENEPDVPTALTVMDNVVLTPHIGSSTVEARAAMTKLVVDNLDRHFAGETVLTPVPEMAALRA